MMRGGLGERAMALKSRSGVAVIALGAVLVAAVVGSTVASAGGTRFATAAAWRSAERCAGAISVTDAKNDTRSWTLPAPPGPAVIPTSADLWRFELRAT